MAPVAIRPQEFPWFDYSNYSFSLGVTYQLRSKNGTGNEPAARAHLSGHTASEHDAESGRIVIRGGMAEQCGTAYAKIECILAAAGLGFGDVERIVEYVTATGVDHYAEAKGVREEVFGVHRPAINTVVVNQLLRPAAFIEIEVMAGGDGKTLTADTRSVGNLVYLSTIEPRDRSGAVVGKGDVVAQTRQILVNAAEQLKPLGLTLDHVVKTVEMFRPEAMGGYSKTASVRQELFARPYPAATGIMQPRVAVDDDVLITCDITACTEPRSEAIRPVGWDWYDKVTFSPAIRAGGMVFLSGAAAVDPRDGKLRDEGGIVGQSRFVLQGIVETLAAAGLGPESLVKTVEYLPPTGLQDYRSTADVRKELLLEPYPPSTGIVCAGLVRPELLIEIDAIAVDGP